MKQQIKRLTILSVFILALSNLLIPANAQTVEQERAAWEALDIHAYHIQIEEVSVWSIMQLEMWITDDTIQQLRATCAPALVNDSCTLGEVRAWQYRLDELFNRAERAGNQLTHITFDPTYHYPAEMFFDDSGLVDDETTIRVIEFEVLPENMANFSVDSFVTATTQAQMTATALAVEILGLTPTPLPATPTAPPIGAPLTATPSPQPTVNAASASAAPPAQPTPLTPQDDLTAWIDAAEAHWNALVISNYDINLSERNPWSGVDVELTVRAGYAVEVVAICQPGWMRGPCGLFAVDTHSFTVPGLFAGARAAAEADYGWHEVLEIDPNTGIPLYIFFDEENIADEEWEIKVNWFTLYEGSRYNADSPPTALPAQPTYTPTPAGG